MNVPSEDFALKRSIRPYIGELIIVGGVAIGAVYVAFKTSTWSLLEAALVGFALYLFAHYFDSRYRVFWKNGAVGRVATNNSTTTIKASDITKVALEKSDLATMLSMRRPSQRITIYGKDQQRLDVSLKHFVIADIRRLVQEIRKERPDLFVPNV